ncbi:MAG: aldo/keto reductase [Cellulosilyticaceae bacterium]
MINRKLGHSTIEVSALGLGTWAIGGGEWWGDSDEETSIQTIHEAIRSGITYEFGKSEEVVGKALKGKRDQVILSTKCGLWWHDERGSKFFEQSGHEVKRCLEPDTIKRELELSLRRLDTDYIDIYFTHWQSVAPYMTEIRKTMACLMDLKKQGLIRAIGASNVTQEHIEEYLKYGELDVIQEKNSMLDRKVEQTLGGCCEKNKLSMMTYSSLEQGLLTGKIGMDYVVSPKEARADIPWYALEKRVKVLEMLQSWEGLTKKYNCTLAQLVIAWTMAQKNMTYVLCGARKPEHIKDTACAAQITLSQEDIQTMCTSITRIGA